MIIERTKQFDDNLFYYIKKKKYIKIKQDVAPIVNILQSGKLIGDKLDNLNLPYGDVYKVRLPNSSTNEGKANGFRLLYYAVLDEKIYLLTIYSKKDDIRVLNDKQIALLAKNILTE